MGFWASSWWTYLSSGTGSAIKRALLCLLWKFDIFTYGTLDVIDVV